MSKSFQEPYLDPSQNAIQEFPARNPGGSTGGTIKSSNEQFPNNQNQPVLGQTQPASGRQANNRNTPVVGQTQPATGQQPNNQIPTTNTNENTNTSTSSPSLVAQSTSTIFTTQIPASQQPDPPISNSPSSNPTFSTQNIALIAAGGSLALVILIGIVALLYYRRWKREISATADLCIAMKVVNHWYLVLLKRGVQVHLEISYILLPLPLQVKLLP